MRNVAALAVLIRFNDDSWQWLTLLGHPVCIYDVFALSRRHLMLSDAPVF